MTLESGPISGVTFRSQAAAALALVVALAAVALDLWLYPSVRGWSIISRSALRLGIAVVSIVITRLLQKESTPLIRWRPRRARRWLMLAASVLAVSVVAGALAPSRHSSVDLAHWALLGLLVDPIVEETLYRQALMIPALAVLGRVGAIVVSSCAFAVLHVIYGNADITNATGGLVLATMFIITESWPTVVVAHSVGNLAILIFNVLVS